MTVSAGVRRVDYVGNGVTKNFPVTFQFFQVLVLVGNVLKTNGVDYTISQTSPGNIGTVVFMTAPTAGASVSIQGAETIQQSVDLAENDPFPAGIIEGAFDRLTMIAGNLDTRLNTVVSAEVSAATALASQEAAATSAAAALMSQNSAAASAQEANTYATAAAASQSTAASSAVAASSSASSANTSATAAAASASSAASSATAAMTSRNNAATSESNAGSAASSAAVAANSASTSFVNFENRYLGAKSANPTLDNYGGNLSAGALYFNTVANEMRVWTGSAWTVAYVPSGSSVNSWNSRTGAVAPASGDYAASQITNDSAVAGAKVKDALDSIASILSTAIVFKGSWDASAGTFPGSGSAQTGWMYKVSVAGTVNGVLFDVGDDIFAVANNASTSTYANNWLRIQGVVSQAEIAAVFPALTGAVQSAGNTLATTQIVDLAVTIGNGLTVISTGALGNWTSQLDFDFDILGWTAVGQESGSISIDVWKCTYAQFDAGATHPVAADKISASAPITYSSATKGQSSILTGWTTSGSAGDILAFNVASVTSSKLVTIALKLRKKT